MAVVVHASIDTARLGESIQVQAEDAFGTIVATITGTYFPAVAGTVDGITYASAIETIVNKLNSLGGSWSGGYTFNTNRFLLSSTTSYKLTMNAFTKKLFGFKDSPDTFITDTASTSNPFFIWVSNEEAITQDTSEFERDLTFRETVSDDGFAFGLGTQGSSAFNFLGDASQNGFTNRNWEFTNEPLAKVFSMHSASLTPYTWEEHMKHVRSYHPWIMFGHNSASFATYEDRVATFKFRGNDSNFRPQPMFRNQSQYWDIPVRAKQLSRGFDFGLSPFIPDE